MEKVKVLENVVQELSVKLLGLEKKLEEVKNKHVNIESMEGFKKFKQEKKKKMQINLKLRKKFLKKPTLVLSKKISRRFLK